MKVYWLVFFLILTGCGAPKIISFEKFSEDLVPPDVSTGSPSSGNRVTQQLPDYVGTDIHHLLYLPTDWRPGGDYPVIVEYAGNRWKTSPGTVEGSNLGYGISGGRGVIWVSMPFVNLEDGRNADTWWGDTDATVAYCKQVVKIVCREFGGNKQEVFLAGFSRGAIACNYIGLHDDEISALWKGFICHSHYDGVREWPYEGSDRKSASERLSRLGNRAQFISHEGSVEETRDYLRAAYPEGRFTFLPLPISEHTDRWVLREMQARKKLRRWFRQQLLEARK